MSGPSTDLPTGTRVGAEFHIVRKLADGGMGAVFVVQQASTGKLRALKVIRREWGDDPEFRARFHREAKLSARIRSDHVVQVVHAGTDAELGLEFLVMELLEGETLAARVARLGALPRAMVLEAARQLTHGLSAAHAIGVIHRDLKPENVYLADATRAGESFVVKILDFGIAKVLAGPAGDAADTLGAAKTVSTRPMGTPAWLAPEQTDRRSVVGPPTDVWAFGLIVFYMLTGKPFWLASNDEDAGLSMLMREMLIDPIPRASERSQAIGGAALPDGFDTWFGRAVVRDPQARFPSIAHATSALESILDGDAQTFAERPTELHADVSMPTGPHAPPAPAALPHAPAPIATPIPAPFSAPTASPAPAGGTPSAVGQPSAPSTSPVKKSSTASAVAIGVAALALLGGGAFGIYRLVSAPGKPSPASSASSRTAAYPGPAASSHPSARTPPSSDPPTGDPPTTNAWVRIGTTDIEMQRHEVTAREMGARNAPPGRPATGVKWSEADAYCRSIGGRLPGEDEWRKASAPLEAAPPLGIPAGVITVVGERVRDRVGGFWDLWGNALEWTSTSADEPGPPRRIALGRHRERADTLGHYFLSDDPKVEPGPLELAVTFGATEIPVTAEQEEALASCSPLHAGITLRRDPGGKAEVARVHVPDGAQPGCGAILREVRWDVVPLPWDGAEANLAITTALRPPRVSLADVGFRCAREAKR